MLNISLFVITIIINILCLCVCVCLCVFFQSATVSLWGSETTFVEFCFSHANYKGESMNQTLRLKQ